MKKKHTKYKSSLLIGLLSLYSLSSCVNTRQTLGNGEEHNYKQHNNHSATYTVNAEDTEDKVKLVSIKENRNSLEYPNAKHENPNNTKKEIIYNWQSKALIGSLVTTGLIFLSTVGLMTTCAIDLSICPFGRTAALPNAITLSINHPNNRLVVANNSFNPINQDGRKGRMYIYKNVDDYTLTLNTSLAKFESKQDESIESESKQNGSIKETFFQGQTIHQLLSQMFNENFDPHTIKDWLKDDLNPNMEDNNGRTLFILVVHNFKHIQKNNLKAVTIIKRLLETGKISLSKKDLYGLTVWDYIQNNNFLKKLFSDIISKKGTPSMRKQKRNAQSLK